MERRCSSEDREKKKCVGFHSVISDLTEVAADTRALTSTASTHDLVKRPIIKKASGVEAKHVPPGKK
jgi:hypothetical protein